MIVFQPLTAKANGRFGHQVAPFDLSKAGAGNTAGWGSGMATSSGGQGGADAHYRRR